MSTGKYMQIQFLGFGEGSYRLDQNYTVTTTWNLKVYIKITKPSLSLPATCI